MLISVIIPCYRSAATIERVVDEIKREILKREGNQYQIILVNDCSPDNTFEVLRELAERDKNIVALDLARNFGQNNARIAAVRYVKGDVAVCMDDDGQHPADQIYTLVDKVQEGYDLVYAKFEKQQQTFFRRMVSRLHTAVQELTGAKKKGIYNSPFLAWSRFSVEALKKYHSPFVSAGAYLMRLTNRVANVEAKQRARMEGKSGYTLKKLLNLWLTEFTNFSLVPLRLSSILGGSFCVLGALIGVTMVVWNLVNSSAALLGGYMTALILFVGGLIMMMIGLLGEYIGKIYMTLSDLPQVWVRTEINVNSEE